MATLTTITGGGAFTAQNIRNINSNFSALNTGSSGGSILHQGTVTLDDDAIKALPSGGVQVVASAGSNRILVPVTFLYIVDTSNGAYTNISVPSDGAYFYLSWESGIDLDVGLQNVSSVSPFVGDDTDLDTIFGGVGRSLVYTQFGIATFAGGNVWSPLRVSNILNAIDKDLTIDCFNNDGPFDDGGTGNSLIASVTYLILNVLTGVFE